MATTTSLREQAEWIAHDARMMEFCARECRNAEYAARQNHYEWDRVAHYGIEALKWAEKYLYSLEAFGVAQRQACRAEALREVAAALRKFGTHTDACGVRKCARCGMRASYDSVPAHYDKANPAHHVVVSDACDCGLEAALRAVGQE